MHPAVGFSIKMYVATFHHSYVSRVTTKFFYSSETFSRSLTASSIGFKKIAIYTQKNSATAIPGRACIRERLSVMQLVSREMGSYGIN